MPKPNRCPYSAQELREKYIEAGTAKALAAEIGQSPDTVRNWMIRRNIPRNFGKASFGLRVSTEDREAAERLNAGRRIFRRIHSLLPESFRSKTESQVDLANQHAREIRGGARNAGEVTCHWFDLPKNSNGFYVIPEAVGVSG